MASRFTDPTFFEKHRWKEGGFVLAVCFAQLLVQDATCTAMTHMYQLVQDFHDRESMMPWYSASLGLAVGTLILFSGRLGDIYGLKRMLMCGYAWTIVWSLICGFSYYDRHAGADLYVCARTFQGCGLAFVLPNALGAAGRVYKPGSLAKRLLFGGVAVCGPLGGFFGFWWSGIIAVRTDRWDWNYYAFAMFAAVVGFITWTCVPNLSAHRNPDGSRPDADWVGAGLAIASMTLFNFAWNQAPVVGWQKAYIIVLLAVSVPMFGVFAAWEIKFATNPLLPKAVLGNGRLMCVLLLEFFGWGTFGINIYHTQVLYQQFRHYTPFAAGSAFAVVAPMGTLASFSSSLMINPKTVEFILLGATLAFLGCSLILATTPVDQSYWRQTFGAWILGPFGMDWSFPAGALLLSEELPPHWQGLAGSLITVAMNYGISIFLGMAGTVEGQLLKQRPDDAWRAWRGAEYFAVGVSGFASVIAFLFVLLKFVRPTRHADALAGAPTEPQGDGLGDAQREKAETDDSFNKGDGGAVKAGSNSSSLDAEPRRYSADTISMLSVNPAELPKTA